ncbi:hypothetical protein U14_02807 [Candidatus Moduliflexus flocculans]|uniref:Uncharacterized protein n=1 Tax=Candidatus Moduliflexus flocculans TaxID=1499966 RepID=A0A081BME6_9BACT|nr:hypothetical protein U14_02807 [Candidatus Moduliflexus flocculans]
MEVKSLLLGLCCTFGMFAVKNGVGMYYALACQRRWAHRGICIAAYSSGYFALFMVSAYLLRRTDMLTYIETVQQILRSGMRLHILMAGMLLLWGWFLLTRPAETHDRTHGWLALALPCPVCLIVIGWSVAFLVKHIREGLYAAVAGVFAGFMLLTFISALLTHLWRSQSGYSLRTLLGAAMMAIAAYFLLSVLMLPQFAEMETVYRLASSRSTVQTAPIAHSAACILSMVGFAGLGFYWMNRKIRRSSHGKY